MIESTITKDSNNRVSQWSDSDENYDVKASGSQMPLYVANAINGHPAISFEGSDVGLAADVQYSQLPNQPFTWIAAVQPTGTGWHNIFATNDAPWSDANSGVYNYHPISMV